MQLQQQQQQYSPLQEPQTHLTWPGQRQPLQKSVKTGEPARHLAGSGLSQSQVQAVTATTEGKRLGAQRLHCARAAPPPRQLQLRVLMVWQRGSLPRSGGPPALVLQATQQAQQRQHRQGQGQEVGGGRLRWSDSGGRLSRVTRMRISCSRKGGEPEKRLTRGTCCGEKWRRA